MKLIRSLVALAALIFASSSFGQGTVNFGTKVGASTVDAPIRDASNALASSVNGFFAQLVYSSTLNGSYTLIGTPVALRSDAGVGYVVSSVVTIAGAAGGSTGFFKVQAWSGAASYLAAKITPGAQSGQTATAVSTTLGDPNAVPVPTLPGNLAGLAGFSTTITPVPEPATFALLGLGALGFALRRRK